MTEKTRSVIGLVVSDRMDKTAAVLVTRQLRHPLYGKYIRRSTKVLAHDAENIAKIGDQVRIRECPPHSKRKAWELLEVLGSEIMPDEMLTEEVTPDSVMPEAAAPAEPEPEEAATEQAAVEETATEDAAPEEVSAESEETPAAEEAPAETPEKEPATEGKDS